MVQDYKHRIEIAKQVVIDECILTWNGNVGIVNKHSNSADFLLHTRLCLDFRHVNDVSVTDQNLEIAI